MRPDVIAPALSGPSDGCARSTPSTPNDFGCGKELPGWPKFFGTVIWLSVRVRPPAAAATPWSRATSATAAAGIGP